MAKQTFTAGQTLTAAQMTTLQQNDWNWSTTVQTGNYTLVAADAGTREVANAGTAITFTVPNNVFTAGDTVDIHNINTGLLTLAAGTGVTLTSADVLTVTQWQGGTLYFTSASAAIWFPRAKQIANSGLVTLLSQTTFTGATTVTQDNIFTSSYTFYKILCRYTTSSTFPITLVLRASGSDATSNYNNQRFIAQGTATTVDRQTAQSNIVVGQATNGSFFSQFDCELYGPQLAEATNIRSTMTLSSGAYNTPEWVNIWGNHSTATAYDGFKLAVSTGTMTGVYSVYGYGKTV